MAFADGTGFLDGLAQFLGLVAAVAVVYLAVWLKAWLLPWVKTLAERQKIQRQGDLDRARMEAVDSSLATANPPYKPGGTENLDNPLVLTEKARRVFAPIAPVLRQMGREARRADLYDSDRLAYDVEKRFRQFFLEVACKELGLRQRACVVIALELALERSADRPANPDGSVGEVG